MNRRRSSATDVGHRRGGPGRRLRPSALGAFLGLGVFGLVSVAGAAEVPALLPGRVATMAGTHVSCKASASAVICKKAGGLTATISLTGVVRVTRDALRLTSVGKPRVLRNNDGFNVLGTNGVGVYCHVYVAGKATMSCSLDDPVRARGSHGFDMTDSS